MNEIYAALMLHESKREINEENIRKILEAAGSQVDEARIKALVEALKGVNIEEAIKQAVAMPTAAPTEEKKEEKKAEEEGKKKEEEAVAGLASLFG
jgi:large subunit ribosomal protein L12